MELLRAPAVFSIKQRYHGYICAIHDDYISVQLTDERTGEYADAELPKDMIPPDDRFSLSPGSEFVWILGYETASSAKCSEIFYVPRFRQVSEQKLDAERKEIDSTMDSVFGPIDRNRPQASGE